MAPLCGALSVCSLLWGSICHHVEREASHFIPSQGAADRIVREDGPAHAAKRVAEEVQKRSACQPTAQSLGHSGKREAPGRLASLGGTAPGEIATGARG
jgi:hypothetical protein